MPCTPFRLPGGITGIVCTRGRRRAPRCSVPGCNAPSGFQCDYRARGGKTCDRHLCAAHAHEVGAGVHFCPFLTKERRLALGAMISQWFGELDGERGKATERGRILRTFDYCDSNTIDMLIDEAIAPAIADAVVCARAAASTWTEKSASLPAEPGWYLVMVEPDNDWGLMSDTPLQVEFDAYKGKPRAFTCVYDWKADEDITAAVTHWMPMPAIPDAAPQAPVAAETKARPHLLVCSETIREAILRGDPHAIGLGAGLGSLAREKGFGSPQAPVMLTDEQRGAIEWAAARAHVAALGKPIDGIEGQRWRVLRELFRAGPGAPHDA